MDDVLEVLDYLPLAVAAAILPVMNKSNHPHSDSRHVS
jgi:hypothetical protein